jgi:hypothetical protein
LVQPADKWIDAFEIAKVSDYLSKLIEYPAVRGKMQSLVDCSASLLLTDSNYKYENTQQRAICKVINLILHQLTKRIADLLALTYAETCDYC